MSLTAEVQLQSPTLPLVDVVSTVPGMTLQVREYVQPESGPFVFFVEAVGEDFETLEHAVDTSPTISEYVLVSAVESTRLYQIVMTFHRPAEIDDLVDGQQFFNYPTVTPDGWRMKAQFADRDELTTYREWCRDMGCSFQLDRLYESASTDADLIGLTDKQREALCTAYDLGYFDVPRRASMTDVADELGISLPALTERVQRAEASLIEHFVYSEVYKTPKQSASQR